MSFLAGHEVARFGAGLSDVTAALAGDVSGDGRLDIFPRHDNGAIAPWAMNGTCILGTSTLTNPGKDWRAMAH